MDNWKEFTDYLNKKLDTITFAEDENPYEIKHFVGTYQGSKVEVYSKEHPPPHFHVKYDDFSCSYRIETEGGLKKLKGTMDRKIEKKIKYLYEHSTLRELAINTWNETRPQNCPVGEIK